MHFQQGGESFLHCFLWQGGSSCMLWESFMHWCIERKRKGEFVGLHMHFARGRLHMGRGSFLLWLSWVVLVFWALSHDRRLSLLVLHVIGCSVGDRVSCFRSLEPSLLVLHLLGGHPSNGPFALVLHLHKHQPCRPQHLHILSSRKRQSHNVFNRSSHKEMTHGRSNKP